MAEEARETKDTSRDPIQDAIEATMPVFSGHPAMADDNQDKDPNATAKDNTPQVEAPDKDASTPKGGGAEEWKPKYKNHRDAEKAYKEAERAMHDAKQEAKAARDELSSLKKELEVTKEAQETGEATKKDVKEAQKKVNEAETRKEVSQRVKTALVKMNKLDTEDPEYYDKVSDLWAEAGFGGGNVNTQDIETLVDKKVKELISQKDAELEGQKAAKAGVKKANETAAKAGLDMKEGSHDYRLFWMLAEKADRSLGFDEQVQWAVDEVNSFKEGISGKKQSLQAKSFLEENTILERGGSGPPARKVTDIKPMSITDALGVVERRI